MVVNMKMLCKIFNNKSHKDHNATTKNPLEKKKKKTRSENHINPNSYQTTKIKIIEEINESHTTKSTPKKPQILFFPKWELLEIVG